MENKKEEGVKKPLTKAEKKKREVRARKIVRACIQLFFFLAMPGAFAAGFSGAKYIFTQVGTGSVIGVNSFVAALLGLCGFTIVFGRFFCGYVCAFGSTGDFFYAVSGLIQKKIFKRKKQIRLPERVQHVLQKVKYGVLALILILCALGAYGKLSGTSPWDVFSRLAALQSVPAGYTVGVVLLVLIVIGMCVQERFFCQFLCPMGALFAILPILPSGMLHRNEPECIKNCRACRNACPVDLHLSEDGKRNGECIACGQCMTVCPKGNLSYVEEKILPNYYGIIACKAVLFFVMGWLLGLCRF